MLTKEQFVQALFAYWHKTNQVIWQTCDIIWEWNRYEKGRSWCNEFFNTTEGAKYVANDR